MNPLPRLLAASLGFVLVAPGAAVGEGRRIANIAGGIEASDWRELGAESLEAPPELIAAAAPQRGPVHVVTVAEEEGRPEITVTEVLGREATEQAIAEAQADPGVLAVEIDGEVSALQSSPWNDPWRDLQWGLDRLSAEEAAYRVGARVPVTVAVIDSGVQATVTDLSGLVLNGFDYYVPERLGKLALRL